MKTKHQDTVERKNLVNQNIPIEQKQPEKTSVILENQVGADKKVNDQEEAKTDEAVVKPEPKKPEKVEKLEPKNDEKILKIMEEQALNLEKKEEQERAAKEKEDFLNKYLQNRSYQNSTEFNDVTVLMIDDKNEIAHDISSQIASLIRANGAKTVNLFGSAFIADGLFEKVFNGDANIINKLELSKYCDILILGKVSESFAKDSGMENLITVKVSLNVRILSSKTGEVRDSFTLLETGPGFSTEESRNYAYEAIINALNKKLKGFYKEAE